MKRLLIAFAISRSVVACGGDVRVMPPNRAGDARGTSSDGGGNSALDAAIDADAAACGASSKSEAEEAGTGCVARVAADGDYTCAIRTDATLWCWGRNRVGELGLGRAAGYRAFPAQVAPLGAEVADVALHGEYVPVGPYAAGTCAVKRDGSVWCWGDSLPDALNVPIPVQVTSLGTDVAEIEPMLLGFCARKRDGAVWCTPSFGCATRVPEGGAAMAPAPVTALGSDVVELSSMCARKADGSLWCGLECRLPVEMMALGRRVTHVDVDAENNRMCATTDDGSLWCWSAGREPTEMSECVTGVAVGGQICARMTDDTVHCWDAMTDSSPSTVVALGSSTRELAAGRGHVCALKSDKSLWCWGDNAYGQLGDGTTEFRTLPVKVAIPCP